MIKVFRSVWAQSLTLVGMAVYCIATSWPVFNDISNRSSSHVWLFSNSLFQIQHTYLQRTVGTSTANKSAVCRPGNLNNRKQSVIAILIKNLLLVCENTMLFSHFVCSFRWFVRPSIPPFLRSFTSFWLSFTHQQQCSHRHTTLFGHFPF